MHLKVTVRTRTPIITINIANIGQVQLTTVTLTFELAIRFLHATHRLSMVINYTKLYRNPTMHFKVTLRTRTTPFPEHTEARTHTQTGETLYAPPHF